MLFDHKTARRGRFCALLASVSTLPLMFLASGARAGGDECGPVGPNPLPTTANLVICDGPNETAPTAYQTGITYTTMDLTLVHVGDGTGDADDGPTQFISIGGNGDFGTQIVEIGASSSNIVQTNAVSPAAKAAIYARSNTGPVSVTVATTGIDVVGISTQTAGAQGIDAVSSGNVTVFATANITTTGNDATGIRALSGGYSKITGQGTITTSGSLSHGIDNYSTGTAGSKTYLGASGDIVTTNVGAYGIRSIATKGKTTVYSNPFATITTSNTNAVGIQVRAQEEMAVYNHSSISTSGDGADGIQALSWNNSGVGDIKIFHFGAFASSSIVTDGIDSDGIDASTETGSILITAGGSIETKYKNSEGIIAKTSGAGGGNVTVSLTGQVITHANDSAAVFGESVNGFVSVTATATSYTNGITTSGASSGGLVAKAGNSGASAANNGMSIQTSGNNSIGVFAYSSGAGAQARNQSSGEIVTTGDSAHALFASGSRAYAYNFASVSTDGDGSNGVFAMGGQFTQAATYEGSSVLVKGINSAGVFADSAGSGQAFVINRGDVETQGNNNKGISV